jgi:hypothetical protein
LTAGGRADEVAAVDAGCTLEYLLDRIPRFADLDGMAAQWRGVATCLEKRADNYRAMLTIAGLRPLAS